MRDAARAAVVSVGHGSIGGPRLQSPLKSVAWIAVAAPIAGVGGGALAVHDPTVALVGCALVPIAVLGWSFKHLSACGLTALLAVWASSVIDAPKSVGVAGTTGLAVVTGGLAALFCLVWLGVPIVTSRAVLRELRYLGAFVVWACASLSWAGVSTAGVQNVLLYVALFGLTACGAAWATSDSDAPRILSHHLSTACWIGCGIYLVQVATHGPGSKALISPRGFGLFGIIAVSIGMARLRAGERTGGYLAVFAIAAVAASLSRTAFVACLVVTGAAYIDSVSWRAVGRALVAIVLAGGMFYGAVTLYQPFRDRFTQGDVVSVHGAPALNVSGRLELWSATWGAYKSAPVWGHGAGYADNSLSATKGKRAQPHDDYLSRPAISGTVGFGLFVVGYARMFYSARAAARSGARGGTIPRPRASACLASESAC